MNDNGTELEQVIHTHHAGAVSREGLVHLIPVLSSEYLLPSQWVLVLAPTHLLPLLSKYLFSLR